MKVWIGADWDEAKCVVCVGGDKKSRKRHVSRTPTAVRDFVEQFGQVEVVVGIEDGDPVWSRLWQRAGAHVWVFDPKKAKRHQESRSSSGASDDRRSAEALCEMVQDPFHRGRASAVPSAEQQTLQHLVRGHETLSGEVIRLANRLRSLVRSIHPALAPHLGNLKRKFILDLLEAAPTPQAWMQLGSAEQAKLTGRFGRSDGGTSTKPAQVASAAAEDWLDMSDAQSQAAALRLRAVARQLRATMREERAAAAALEEASEQHEGIELLTSVKGIGPKLGAGIALAAIGLDDASARDELARRTAVAPVTSRSGTSGDERPRVTRRYAATSLMKNIGYLVGVQAMRRMQWARAQYKHYVSRGNRASTAFRKVGRSVMRILQAILANGTPFDEEAYVAKLKRNGVEWAAEL